MKFAKIQSSSPFVVLFLLGFLLNTVTVNVEAKNDNKYKQILSVIDSMGTGEQEVTVCDTSTTARLGMTFYAGFSSVEFELDVYDGVNITQAHLHCAPAGVNGPVVAFLFGLQPPVHVDGELVYGEIMNDDIVSFDDPNGACGVTINNVASLYEAILQRKIYLNVHSTACPAGVTRAQMIPHMAY